MLAIRHMVESDLPFLVRQTYTAAQRSSFLRSYLSHVGGILSPSRFEQVLDQLVNVELELRLAKAGVLAALAALLPQKFEEQQVGGK